MSVEFSNAYQDILFDNLVSIIKQNMVFQTQLKLAEEVGKAKAELQVKFDELVRTHENTKSQLSDFEIVKAKLQSSTVEQEEKLRLQTALNDIMKKTSTLQKQIDSKDLEIANLKIYVEKLEKISTPSKLKKLNPPKIVVEQKPVEQPAKLKDDGSSF